MLLSPTGEDTLAQARDSIATLLTRQGGDYLFRLGARPPTISILSDGDLDKADGWTGCRRTEDEVDAMIARLCQLVEDVGGKVFFHSNRLILPLMQWPSGLYLISGKGTAFSCFSVASITSG